MSADLFICQPYDVARDATWVQGLQTDNAAAFDEAFLSLVPALWTFARRFVGADVAEDVVQDVMIDLWERRATIVVRGTLRSYLFGAVRRRIADHQRHDGVVERHAAQQLPVVTVSSEHILDADELERATAAALATLSARSRAILEFRWHSGLSYSEIADALGVSEEAAKKQGRRAELVVRALLARFAPPD